MSEVRRRAGAAPDDRATVRRPGGPGAVARQKGVGDEPVFEAPIRGISPETGGCGLLGCLVRVAVQGHLLPVW
jgi:hypothetical protein